MRTIAALTVCVLLSACAADRAHTAADVCIDEATSKLADKRVDYDRKQLAASARETAPDTWQISAPLVFDAGLASEYTQILDCRVRFDDSGAPSVLFMQFNWSMDDVRKSNQSSP
ncbi:MAG: hypothetical protein ABIY56_04015 [Dokdonella sp.]